MTEPRTPISPPSGRRQSPDEEQQQNGANTQPTPSRVTAPAKAAQITSLQGLFDYAFSLKGKQVRVPQKVLKEIAERTTAVDQLAVDSLRDSLDALMASDPFLKVPPRLLVGLEDSDAPILLKLRIARLLVHQFQRHPLFRSAPEPSPGAEVADLSSGAIDFDEWLTRARLRAADISAAELGNSGGSLKPADRERLRTNAITAVALLGSIIEEWGDHRLVHVLERFLWRDAVAKPGVHRPRVAITESAPPEALGFVSRVFLDSVSAADRTAKRASEQAAQADERANNLLARANAASKEGERLRTVIEGKEGEIAALQGRIEALQAQIDAERRDRVIDQSHHIDEYDVLRTRIMRSLGKQVDLLSDGLHAVRNQSYSVTEEFIERALDSMSKELHQLNEEGDG